MSLNLAKAKNGVNSVASAAKAAPLYGITPSRGYRPGATAVKYLADRYCIRHQMTEEAYASRPREGLWWNVTSNTMKVKSTMRSWCKRRLTRAILEAFRAQGFDRRGLPLSVVEGSRLPPRTSGPTGTITVFCQEALLRATAEETRRAGEGVVREAMRRAGVEWIEWGGGQDLP